MLRQYPAEVEQKHWLAEVGEVQALRPWRCSALWACTPSRSRIHGGSPRRKREICANGDCPWTTLDRATWSKIRWMFQYRPSGPSFAEPAVSPRRSPISRCELASGETIPPPPKSKLSIRSCQWLHTHRE